MELGATICTPSSPSCERCPLRFACRAFAARAAGPVTRFPAPAAGTARRVRRLAVAAIEADGHMWMLVRRPPKGLLAGQLEFPSIQMEEERWIQSFRCSSFFGLKNFMFVLVFLLHPPLFQDENGVESTESCVQRLTALLKGFQVDLLKELTPVEGVPLEHIFSHEHHFIHLFRGHPAIPAPQPARSDVHQAGRPVWWLGRVEAEEAGITSGVKKAGRVASWRTGAGCRSGSARAIAGHRRFDGYTRSSFGLVDRNSTSATKLHQRSPATFPVTLQNW